MYIAIYATSHPSPDILLTHLGSTIPISHLLPSPRDTNFDPAHLMIFVLNDLMDEGK